MSLPAYPKYKDSGVTWLGKVPAHWEIVTLGRISTDRCDGPFGSGIKSEHYTDQGALVVRLQNIRAGAFSIGEPVFLDQTYFDSALRGHEVLEGDVLIAGLGDDNNLLGRACVAPDGLGSALVKADCFRFRIHSERALPDFVAMQLSAGASFDAGILATGTTRSRIPLGVMAARKVALPSLSEQTSIAAFIDCETGKIDALIAEQEKLLTLLAEKRQATISHAVKRGLNRDAPMKDSGSAWLGEVPAHWDVLRIKRVITSIEQGWSPQCENFPVEGVHEWGVMKVGCVNGGVFDATENKKLPSELAPIPAYSLRKGDLLISRANTRDLVGSSAVVPDDFENLLLCDKLYRIRTNLEVCTPDFLAAFLSIPAARAQIELEATGASSSMLNIAQSVILELSVPFPDTTEQSAIMECISAETNKLDTLKAEAERTIDLLKERRSALITAAVTGKIDVRNAMQQELAA
ncbi:hypothetical protein [Burkholderia metallica]